MRRLLLGVCAVIAAGCSAEGNRPGIVVLPGMVASVPYDSYDPNPLTPHGGTLLAPPEGTVPYGASTFPYGPEPDEAARAGRELSSPLAPSDAALARGKHVYDTFCLICHGPGGEGDGPIIGRFPNPPSFHTERARNLPDGHLFHVISRGQGIMSPYVVQVRPDDRWRVVLYIRTLQAVVEAVAEAAAEAGTGSEETTP